jgi:hypothetical protein
MSLPFALIPPSSPNIPLFFCRRISPQQHPNSVSLLILCCVNSSLTKPFPFIPSGGCCPLTPFNCFCRENSPGITATTTKRGLSPHELLLLHKMGHHQCQVVSHPVNPSLTSTSPFTRLFPHSSIHFNLNRFETFPFVLPKFSHEVSNGRPLFDR